jgi:hypothetical protein
MTLHTKPGQGEQQLKKQQKQGGGKGSSFWNKTGKKEGKVRCFSLFHDKDQKKTSSRHFEAVSVSTFFLYSFFRRLKYHNG